MHVPVLRFRGNAGSHDVALGVDTLRVRVRGGGTRWGWVDYSFIHSFIHTPSF